jgi:hypothetical protein
MPKHIMSRTRASGLFSLRILFRRLDVGKTFLIFVLGSSSSDRCLLSFTLKRHCKMVWLMCLPCQLTLCKFHSSYRLQGKLPLPDTSNAQIPTVRPSFLLSRAGSSSSLRATWLGHASCFVEFPSGFRALFDPVFEEQYISMGPKRFTPAACKPGSLGISQHSMPSS